MAKSRSVPDCVVSAAKRSGISRGQLLKSYKRGIGAWKTNPSSVRNKKGVKGGPGKRMSKQRWACARVNKLARLKHRAGYDKDLLIRSVLRPDRS